MVVGDHQLAEPFRNVGCPCWLGGIFRAGRQRAKADERPRRKRPTWSHRFEQRLVSEVAARYDDVVEQDAFDDGDGSLNSRFTLAKNAPHEQSVMQSSKVQFVSRLLQRKALYKDLTSIWIKSLDYIGSLYNGGIPRTGSRNSHAFCPKVTKDWNQQ